VYVLIDCGYKPGSPRYINTSPKEITASIREATGGHIHVAVITHEHQDHVNAITPAIFRGITIGQTWLAWTEDPNDPLANRLRAQFNDRLLGLIAARKHLAAAKRKGEVEYIDQYLSFEVGGEDGDYADGRPGLAGLLAAAAADPARSRNKQSMKLFKDSARNGVKYVHPHEEIITLPGAPGVRVFALGPPRHEERLEDLNPTGDEEFHGLSLASASAGIYFAAAAAAPDAHGVSPFPSRFAVPLAAAARHPELGAWFTLHYGADGTPPGFEPDSGRGPKEAHDNMPWRRIDKDWLYSAGQLALDMNNQTNNSSLVLAFELGKGGKVMLFAADAHRGNWLSWGGKEWTDGQGRVSARDLLARTVLYKVGHHGSHNATLNGVPSSEYPCLGWMGHGDHGREFTAMITAVRAWAETQEGWDHPLKAIKDALLKKASGRVFQTDTAVAEETPEGASAAEWKRFRARVREDRLYFDYEVTP
jgi:hypothetical protein